MGTKGSLLSAPSCFDSASEYVEYLVSAGLDPRRHPRPARTLVPRHCFDCTPEFQANMAAAGRCHQPDIVFIEFVEAPDADPEPSIVGASPNFIPSW